MDKGGWPVRISRRRGGAPMWIIFFHNIIINDEMWIREDGGAH